jgi:demethylmenaquinone methyltransferase/2-methoxy-6-polyprenyl-1,4-benzoquinol methylase
MTTLKGLNQRECLADPQRKQLYVTVMFDEIAPRYDRFTRWFSHGLDSGWKGEVLKQIQEAANSAPAIRQGLDIACGTGDLARLLAEAMPGVTIAGVDISPVMIACAQPHPQVVYRVGDATRLEEADGSVQVVTIGYGLRNLPDYMQGLREIHRVLAPGSLLGILEFTRPETVLWRWIFLGYLWLAGTIYGWWWHGHGPVYGYIARSIARFATRRELTAQLGSLGFDIICQGSHLGGGVAVIVARKRA